MDKIVFNSKSEIYKKPFGAVSTANEVIFSIHISKTVNPLKVSFIYRLDNKAESLYRYMQKTGEYDCFNIFSCKVNFTEAGLYFYRFEIETEGEKIFAGLKDGHAFVGEWLDEWQLTVYSDTFKTPDWAKGGIMYQIFPDRFAKSKSFVPETPKNPRKIHENWFDIPEFIYDNPDYKANDYFMGNIKGIIEKLDYIKSLGVNIIYLNPVFESAEYHRYSTANYLKIDPFFGTNEDFKELCTECKKRDIGVILDGVFSHTGADSIYFNKYGNYESCGAYNSKESPYFSWYNFISFPEKYESWWGFDNLPNVNETNPEYLEYITGENGVLSYWQRLGASGWRLDVADELPDEFLDRLYARAKSENSEAFVVGEVWEDATNKFSYGSRRRYLLGGQMDSVMNYPWRTAILEFVKNRNEKLFYDRLISIMENYPSEVLNCLMNSISTHDTVRAITYLGVNHDVEAKKQGCYVLSHEEYSEGKEKLLLATFLQFTLPGIPCIYYGDEVGLSGFRDPYSRKTYPYGRENFEILDFYKKIADVRVAYRENFIKPFKLHAMQNGFFSFWRGELLCAVNSGTENFSFNRLNKSIIFSQGDYNLSESEICLHSMSMIILK